MQYNVGESIERPLKQIIVASGTNLKSFVNKDLCQVAFGTSNRLNGRGLFGVMCLIISSRL